MRHQPLVWFFAPALLFVFTFTFNACENWGVLTPEQVRQNHSEMFEAVKDYVNLPENFQDGEWQKHWGDGGFFGPSLIVGIPSI